MGSLCKFHIIENGQCITRDVLIDYETTNQIAD